MKVFTHQSKEFIKLLLIEGFIENNGKLFSEKESVEFAYKKLIKYAKDNVSNEFKEYPIWCWYKRESAILKNGIKIELEVPDGLVLLTDYYDWGGGVLYYSELLFNGVRYEDGINVEEEIENNFSNCVNQKMLRDDIQAIIPYIKLEWVTNKKILEEFLKK